MQIKRERILQRITAETPKINRYQGKVSQFQQNMFFRDNEGRFYKEIDRSEEGEEIVIPDAQEAKTFWTDIGVNKWNLMRMRLC